MTICKATSHHEAGHVVTWTVMTGDPPYRVDVPFFGLMGGATTHLYENPRRCVPKKHKTAHIVSTLAGACAQSRFQRRGFAKIWDSWRCFSDRELLQELYGVTEPPPELLHLTRKIVRAHWDHIEWIAQKLIGAGGFLHTENLWVIPHDSIASDVLAIKDADESRRAA